MDQLSIDNMEARRLGLSYGKYIALYRPEKPRAERYPKRNYREQEKRPFCVICGAPIPAGSHRRKYCSPACADQAAQEWQHNARKRQRKGNNLKEESRK